MHDNDTKKVAVIDVGTLKSKFEIREYQTNLTSRILYKDKQLTVLGRDLDKTNNIIVDKSILKTIEALTHYRTKLDEYSVDKYIAVTTEAIRKARNAPEVLRQIKKTTGISLVTLTHEQEAEIYFHSVSKDFPHKLIAVADIGGGSVQVVIGKDKDIYEKHLFKTGTYFLQEGFSKTHHPSAEEVQAAFNYVKEQLNPLLKSAYKPELIVYGSTNIIDFLKAMNLELISSELDSDHPFYIHIDALKPLYEQLISLSYEDRMLLYPEEPYYMWAADKALMNIFTVAEYLNTTSVVPSNNNISTGLLLSLLEEI